MRQWVLQSMNSKGSTFLAVAGAMALVVGTAACGGGGGSTTTTTPDTTTTVGGLASDGLLMAATVNVYSRDDATACVSGPTTSEGKYSLAVPSACLPPLRIEVSGGTDKTTGKTNDLTLRSLVMNTSQTTANLSPQTTMMAYAMQAAAGGSLTAMAGKSTSEQSQLVTTASTAVLKSFGFGADASVSGFNPMTTPITTTAQTTAFSSAADAAGEVVRRLTSSLGSANTANVAAAMQAIGQQLVGANSSTGVTIGATTLSLTSLEALVSTQKAVVSAEVLTGSLTRNTVSATSTTMASAGTLATTSILSSLSTAFQQQMQSDVKVAKALGVFSTAMETAMNTAITAATTGGSASLTVPTGESLATMNTSATSAVSTISTTAGAALNAVNFRVQPSVMVMDYPLGTTASQTSATMSQTVDSAGVMTANFPSALSATNLSNVGKGTGIAPVVQFSMANLDGTKGSGVAVVTATLVDGTNATRDAGERYISVNTSLNWTSTGTTLTLTAPAGSVAPVSYYTASSTAAATATLNNSGLDVLSTITSGTAATLLNVNVAGLFSQLSATSLDANGSKGNYYYKVTISGLPLSACNSTESSTSCSTSTAKPFSTVQGTISAQ
ncbi:MAG: hypothetical protein HQL99_06955 [Magnetococcales bacterium]|nr:hypothetical protein [Magnetococcales bacterium]